MTQPPYPPRQGQSYQQEALPGCWWHPNRQTGLRCTRCERPACPDCLRDASVGQQCIDCVNTGQRQAKAARAGYRRAGFGKRTVAGARYSQRVTVTPVLIGINVLVFVFTEFLRPELFTRLVLQPLMVSGADQWARLITSGFLHFTLLHIGMNMLALWILGRELEVVLGRLRFAALYFVSLLGGSAAVFVLGSVKTATAGASGAVFGLMGAMLVAVLKLRLNPTGALAIVGVNLIITFTIPGISLLGHIGGLVVGALVMLVMLYAPATRRAAWQGGSVALIVVVLIGLVIYRDAALAFESCEIIRNRIFCSRS